MKNMLMRPSAALFPAVLLLSALKGDRAMTSGLFFFWCCVQLFSLCSVDAFRNAAAREPGVRRVDKRFSGTWPMILLGMAVTGIIAWFTGGWEATKQDALALAVSAGFITIEQAFEERMFALSRRTDGVVLDVLSNVLLLAGMMLDASGGVAAPVDVQFFFTACGTALGMLISIIASYVIEPMHAFSLVPRNIAFFPKAAVQCLLYPLAMAALVWLETWLDDSFLANLIETMGTPPFMLGLALWRLSRTVCRRAQDESRPLNLLLIAVCAITALSAVWMVDLAAFAATAWIALICALIVFCAPGWRIYAGAALLWAAMYFIYPGEVRMVPAIACCAAAVVLNLHKAFLRKV